ncbi:MAG: hypothetical protein RL701_7652, partial [Pseudomonadota bacterium]
MDPGGSYALNAHDGQHRRDCDMRKVGRDRGTLTRRDALEAFGVLGAGLWIGCAGDSGGQAAGAHLGAAGSGGTPGCVLIPAMTEGPFFVDERLERNDLRGASTDQAVVGGLPLQLDLAVYRVSGTDCAAWSGAQVDVWHANTEGLYSDKASNLYQKIETLGSDYLRGYQRTDAQGRVSFNTIYPGWY